MTETPKTDKPKPKTLKEQMAEKKKLTAKKKAQHLKDAPHNPKPDRNDARGHGNTKLAPANRIRKTQGK